GLSDNSVRGCAAGGKGSGLDGCVTVNRDREYSERAAARSSCLCVLQKHIAVVRDTEDRDAKVTRCSCKPACNRNVSVSEGPDCRRSRASSERISAGDRDGASLRRGSYSFSGE